MLDHPLPFYQRDGITLHHGDCVPLLASMPTASIDLCLTDPPYGVGAIYGDGQQIDDSPGPPYWDWWLAVLAELRRVCRTVVFTHRVEALRHCHDWDWVGVWQKPRGGGVRVGNSCIVPGWEPIFFYGIHHFGPHSRWLPDVLTYNPVGPGTSGGKHGRDSWSVSRTHPLPKPEALWGKLLAVLGQDAQTVIDPFAGSGTTLKLAKTLGLMAVGIELVEAYCAEIAARLAQEVLPLPVAAEQLRYG